MDISIAGGCVTFSLGRTVALPDLARVQVVLATFTPFESAIVDASGVEECDPEAMRGLAREFERIPFVRFRLAPNGGREQRILRWLTDDLAEAGAASVRS